MKHIKLFEELTGKFKEETIILYKDKNLVCLVPKSQMSSCIFSHGTKWCSKYNSGFDIWTRSSHLLRFIFKDGTKIRLTYGSEDRPGFNWSDKTGAHYFDTSFHVTKDPFNEDIILDGIMNLNKSSLDKNGRSYKELYRDMTNLGNRIKSIPEECMDKVREFLSINNTDIYIHRDKNYQTHKVREFSKIEYDFNKFVKELIKANGHKIVPDLIYDNGEYIITIDDEVEMDKEIYKTKNIKELARDIEGIKEKIRKMI